MLKGLIDYFDNLQTVNDNQLAFTIYKSVGFEFLVVSLITEGQPTSQLKKGKGADGEIIGVYSVATQFITRGKKKAGNPYTLKDTGFYYDSHEVIAALTGFTIVANAQKEGSNFLTDLGIDEDNVQSLSDGNLQIVIDEFKELFSEEFRAFLDKHSYN